MRILECVGRTLTLAVVLVAGACSPSVSVPTTTASPVSATTPSPASPTPSPSPTLPPADKLLSESYSAMQRVTSVRVATSKQGVLRSYNTVSGVRSGEIGVTGTIAFQQSADRKTDAYHQDVAYQKVDQVNDTTRSRAIRIGAEAFFQTERRSLGVGPWTLVPQQEPLLFPDEGFARFDAVVDSAVKLSPSKTEGIVQRGATATYKVTSTGPLVDSGQALLRGTYVRTVWIAVDGLLWMRAELSKIYEDGQRYDESTDFSDYNVPNVIARPPTK